MARHQQNDRRPQGRGGADRPAERREPLRTQRPQDEDFGGAPHLGAMGDPAEGKTADDARG
jgi:hypothetical protein